MDCHWAEKSFVPLNREELPEELAGFIGNGRRAATVLVQTLPLYISGRFEKVSVYDISEPQINFHINMLDAANSGNLKDFIGHAKVYIFNYACLKKYPTNKDAVNSSFNRIYEPLYNKNFKNISVDKRDIFDAIDHEDPNDPHDVIFLSTIPSLDVKKNWLKHYGKIHVWLEKNKTVIFSLLVRSFFEEDLYKELMWSFEDVADRSAVLFEDSAPMIHVKFTPKK